MPLRELDMALTKLGLYIKQCDLRNTDDKYVEDDVVGISTQKMMIHTKADLIGVKLTSYKLVPPRHFAYVSDTSRRGDKMSLCYNSTESTYIVSSISTVFYVSDKEKLNPEYLFMYFNRPEFDRFSRFNSWGSARETFSWEDMCDIDIELPPLPVQQKYVDVYNAMLANQKSYERGLDDLKLTCDAYIENLRRKIPCEPIGQYIAQTNVKNELEEDLPNRAVSNTKVFVDAKDAIVSGVDTKNYQIVKLGDFAYNTVTTRNADKLSIALNREHRCLVSPLYTTFRVIDDKLLPEYLSLWFNRSEYDRFSRFNSWGSARELFTFNTLSETMIPIPEKSVQKSIANIYDIYFERKSVNEKLKAQIKNICPILIKGSIEEAEKEA